MPQPQAHWRCLTRGLQPAWNLVPSGVLRHHIHRSPKRLLHQGRRINWALAVKLAQWFRNLFSFPRWSVSVCEVQGLQSEHWICTLRPGSLGSVTTLNFSLFICQVELYLPIGLLWWGRVKGLAMVKHRATSQGISMQLGNWRRAHRFPG